MSKPAKIWTGLAATVVVLAMGTATLDWLGNRSTRRVMALQQQLLESSDLSRADQNALKAQLMRTVDEMDRNQLRDLYDTLREQRRAEMQTSMKAFQAASAAEKLVVLDAAIDRMAQTREVYAALRTDGMRGRGRRPPAGNKDQRSDERQNRRDDRTSQDRPARGDQAPGNQNRLKRSPDGQNRQRPNRDPSAKNRQGRDRPEWSAEQRELRDEYFAALAARPEERGIEIGGDRRGDRAGKRNPARR